MTNSLFSTRLTITAKWLKRLLYILISLGLILLAATGLMTFFATPPSAPHPLLQGYNTQPPKYHQNDLDAAVNHLSHLLSVPTTNPQYKSIPQKDLKPFIAIQNYLQNSYPAFHALARRRILAQGSILYFWPGSNNTLEPALWLSHMDVLPPPHPKEWLFPPFSGAVADSGIWGKGSLSNKTNLVAMLEALDSLARSGFKPQRGIYLAFSHDAKSLNTGNKAISQLLKSENLSFSYILNEGGYITERFLPKIEQPIAFIGIAEKGRTEIDLTQEVKNSDGMLDKAQQASLLDNLTKEIDKLELKTNDTVLQYFLKTLAPYMTFKQRWAVSNHWLLSGLVRHHAKKNQQLTNMFTTSITVETSQQGQNTIGSISIHTLPDTNEDSTVSNEEKNTLIQQLKTIVAKEVSKHKGGNSNNIRLQVAEPSYDASAITPIEGKPYQLLWQSINQTYKNRAQKKIKAKIDNKQEDDNEIVVAPILQLEQSSASFYQGLSEHILRFNYLPLSPETQSSLTGIDEHIAEQDLLNAITFYYLFAKNSLVDY